MHPIAFEFGSLSIHWYGVMVAVAFLAGLWNASRRAPGAGIHAERIMDLGPWLVVGGLIGARALYVVSYWNQAFAGEPVLEIFKVWHGGLVFYGGLIGASLACLLFARLKNLPLWNLADVLAPGIALGSMFGRVGCLLNGCCYGRLCALPWAIHFPPGHETHPHGVHPTQVYDAGLNLLLYLGLGWWFRHRKFEGQVFAVFLVGYAVFRSSVELFRGDYQSAQHYLGGWATPAHLVSVGILGAGVVLLVVLPRLRPAPHVQPGR